MKRNRVLQIMMLRELRGDEKGDYDNISVEERTYNAALLIDEGLVEGKAYRAASGGYGAVTLLNLTTKGENLLDEIDAKMNTSPTKKSDWNITIFISHSSLDKDLAGKLAGLFQSAFRLSAKEIRCTSAEGYKLTTGADTELQLKSEVLGSRLFVGLMTPASISSTWVLFELGARWGAGLSLFPILARGCKNALLKGPLGGKNALDLVDRTSIYQLIDDIGEHLEIEPEKIPALATAIEEICALASHQNNPSPRAREKEESTEAPDKNELKILQWFFRHHEEKTIEDVSAEFELQAGFSQYYLDNLLKRELLRTSIGRRNYGRVNKAVTMYKIAEKGRALVVEGVSE